MSSHPLLANRFSHPRRRKRPTVVMTRMDEFLATIDPSLSAASQQVVRRVLWSLRRGLKGEAPTVETILGWMKQRVAVDKVKASTLALERVYANKFFKWAVERGYMEKNPVAPIPSVPIKVVNKPLITEAQKAQLIAAGLGTFWPYLIEMAWVTGARSSDLVALEWRNISAMPGIPTPYKVSFVPRKTAASGREVSLILPPHLNSILNDRVQINCMGLICPEAKQIHDRANGDFQTQFRKLCNKAGLPKTITFHCFRHTRASRMLNADDPVSLLTAADVLGLSSLATLRKYTKASDAAKLKAVSL